MMTVRPHIPSPLAISALTSTAEDKATKTTENDSKKTTQNMNTAGTLDPDATTTATGKGKGKSGGSRGNSTRTGKEEFDYTDPPGGGTFMTPDPRLGPPLYKAGDEITFGWNYTNVLADPTAVDVILSCSANSAVWTLTSNMSFEDPGSYTWDSKVQQTDSGQRLITEEYVLIIKDSEVEIGDAPENGYFSQATLGLNIYTPKAPTPMSEWDCITCSAGVPELDRRALGFVGTMCLITVASFTWFVAGLNL